MAGYLIQIGGVCLGPDDVNNFMERSIRVLLTVGSRQVTKNAIVRDFGEAHLWEVTFLRLLRFLVNFCSLSPFKALWLHILSFLLGLLFSQILLS